MDLVVGLSSSYISRYVDEHGGLWRRDGDLQYICCCECRDFFWARGELCRRYFTLRPQEPDVTGLEKDEIVIYE